MAEFQVHPSSPRLVRDSKDAGDLGLCWSHVTGRPREGVCEINRWSNSGTELDKVHPSQPQLSFPPACAQGSNSRPH